MSYPEYPSQHDPEPYRPLDVPYHEPNTNPYYNGPPATVWSVGPRPSDFVAIPQASTVSVTFILF